VTASATAAGRATPEPLPRDRGGWLRRLSPFLLAHRGKVAAAVGASIFGQTILALAPAVEKVIVDDVLVEQRRALGPLLTLLIAVGVVGFAAAFVRRYIGGRVALEVTYDLRNAIFQRLQALDVPQHDAMETGQVVSRASSDVGMLLSLLSVVPALLGSLVLLLVSLIVMFVLSPPLTLVAILIIPTLLWVGVRMRERVFPATWDAQQRAGEVAGVVDEAVSGVRVVKGFGQEQRELRHLADTAGDLYRSRTRLVRLQAVFTPTLSSIPMVGQVAVLAFGGWLALNGRLSLGAFLAFSSYLVQMVAPVRMLATTMAVAQQARAGAERILDILDTEPAIVDAPGAIDLPRTGNVVGDIAFEGVTFGYGGAPVLDRFDLRITAGETVALVGGSGSGKSSAAALLPRFYDVQHGRLTIGGHDVRDVTLSSLRRSIAVVPEEVFLFSDTVRANIGYGRPDATDAEVAAVARIAQADAFIHALPDGYHTVVGERGLTLSGGQRQRIALARALLADPAVLVLDDATSSIDADTEEQIHVALHAVARERTTILIAHRHSTLRLADRIVVLDHGRVVADGPYDDLMATSETFRSLFADPTAAPTTHALPRLSDENVSLARQSDRITASAWPVDGDGDGARHVASVRQQTGSVNANRRGGMAGMHDVASALSATPQLLDALERLPPADDDPDLDVDAEMAADPGSFSLRSLLRPFRLALVLGLALVVVDTGLLLLGPYLVRRGIDHGVLGGSERALWIAAGLFLLVAAGDWIATRAYTWVTGRTAERALYALRIRIFGQLQRLSLDYYDRELGGRIMTRMTTDVDALAQVVQTGLIAAIVSVATCLGVLVWLVVLSPPLALVAATVIVPLAASTVLYRRFSRRSYDLARDRISALNADFQESLSGVRIAKAFGREQRNAAGFQELNGRYLDARLTSQRLIALYFPFVALLADAGAAVVLGAGTELVQRGTITAGVVIAFLLYLDQFFSPIQQLSQVFDTWQQATVSLSRIDELMDTPTGTPPAADPIAPPALTGRIEFRDVDFSYPAAPNIPVLRGLDLEIAAGETVALVGETGAGKSTLVKLIARFYDPRRGSVRVDGLDIRELDLGAFRRQLGFVPQEAFLFTGTIRDNIAYGRPDASDADVEAAARAVGAHDVIAAQPRGYLTPMSERGRSLSAGERQLIALARARLVDPAILLLDEATSNLDLATERRVQAAMATVAAGRTTVLIAHRLPTARTADRIVVVADGRVAEQGTHDELLARGGTYAGLWHAFDGSLAAR
jgi:ATP-binding cassette subfamily B protein